MFWTQTPPYSTFEWHKNYFHDKLCALHVNFKQSDLIGRATFQSLGQLVHSVTRPLFHVRSKGLGHKTRSKSTQTRFAGTIAFTIHPYAGELLTDRQDSDDLFQFEKYIDPIN